jgi:hypothetical protein
VKKDQQALLVIQIQIQINILGFVTMPVPYFFFEVTGRIATLLSVLKARFHLVTPSHQIGGLIFENICPSGQND